MKAARNILRRSLIAGLFLTGVCLPLCASIAVSIVEDLDAPESRYSAEAPDDRP